MSELLFIGRFFDVDEVLVWGLVLVLYFFVDLFDVVYVIVDCICVNDLFVIWYIKCVLWVLCVEYFVIEFEL